MINMSDFVAVVVAKVRKSWGLFLVTGILLIILGVLCVGKAQTATTISILTLGWILVISAAVWLACALYTFGVFGIFVYLPNQIIRGLTGYLLVRQSEMGAEGVTILLASRRLPADDLARSECILLRHGDRHRPSLDGATLVGFATAIERLPEVQHKAA